jgi:hypothetical protein
LSTKKILRYDLWKKNSTLSAGDKTSGASPVAREGNMGREDDAAVIERCPRCASARLYRWGKAAGLQRFRCRSCGRTFNVTGSPDADSHTADYRTTVVASPPPAPMSLDFIEWARAASSTRNGAAMRKRLVSLFASPGATSDARKR